jgi:hypothetical protein
VTCRACDGADRPGKASVAIVVHGTMAKYFAAACKPGADPRRR